MLESKHYYNGVTRNLGSAGAESKYKQTKLETQKQSKKKRARSKNNKEGQNNFICLTPTILLILND